METVSPPIKNAGRLNADGQLMMPGAVYASRVAQSLLSENEFSQVDQVFAHPDAVATRHIGRAVFSTRLQSEGDASEVFVKLHWGRRPWLPRFHDLAAGALFRPLPRLEWNGLQQFRDAGLNVPERLALLDSRSKGTFRAAIIMRALPVRLSIHDLLRFGKWLSIPSEDRTVILKQVAEIAHRIHAAGLGWRGISCKHFLPERRSDGQWRLWLLDCEGVRRLRGQRMRSRDLKKLYGSFTHMHADAETLAVVSRHLFEESAQSARRAA